uniref:Uncharacterized protein n=1 Tax=Nymphaea colorata TaxID=210225 RepID=A0A5K1GC47_9MAGN
MITRSEGEGDKEVVARERSAMEEALTGRIKKSSKKSQAFTVMVTATGKTYACAMVMGRTEGGSRGGWEEADGEIKLLTTKQKVQNLNLLKFIFVKNKK